MSRQTELFNRRCGSIHRSTFGDRVVMSSTTWMLRHALMADFKVRAACKHLEFRRLRVWNKKDEDGDTLAYDTESRKDEDGQWRRHILYDENHKPKTHKRRHLESPVSEYSRKDRSLFPSDDFATNRNDYFVTGDDGTTWEIGSRGNDIDILVQEVASNPILWPDEKAQLIEYLRGDRKIPDRHATREEDPYYLHKRVDGYFCRRILGGEPVTEDEIRESGLPDETVENLIDNLRNMDRDNG